MTTDYMLFEKEGFTCAVDTDTGEIIDTITVTLPVGSKVYTPAQQEAYKKHKDYERNTSLKKAQSNELGYFYFILKDHQLGKISAETVGRLIYLLTYLDYDSNFMISQRKPMKKSDLEKIMNLSKWTIGRFWKEIHHLYVEEYN